ncbi:11318_t:CDS:2, partial [Acaulospora morrowiae]
RELRNNDRFSQWWSQNSKTALILTIFSGIDNEALKVIYSYAAGYTVFREKSFSQTGKKLVLFATIFSLIIEDFAQLIYLIIYQAVTIIPAIIPIIVLATCILIILLKIICFILYMGQNNTTIVGAGPEPHAY